MNSLYFESPFKLYLENKNIVDEYLKGSSIEFSGKQVLGVNGIVVVISFGFILFCISAVFLYYNYNYLSTAGKIICLISLFFPITTIPLIILFKKKIIKF